MTTDTGEICQVWGPRFGTVTANAKLKRFAVTPELLISMFKEGTKVHFEVDHGLPDDAELVRCYTEPHEALVWVVVHVARVSGWNVSAVA